MTLTVILTESVLILFSGAAKKLGEKIVTGLGIGAAASGTYQGVKEVINDIKDATKSSDTKSSDSSKQGSNNDKK